MKLLLWREAPRAGKHLRLLLLLTKTRFEGDSERPSQHQQR